MRSWYVDARTTMHKMDRCEVCPEGIDPVTKVCPTCHRRWVVKELPAQHAWYRERQPMRNRAKQRQAFRKRRNAK